MLKLMVAMFIWGTLGIFVLWSELPAIDVAFYRCLIVTVLMGLWLVKTKQRISLNKSSIVASIAGICLVLNWIFLFKSFQVTSITVGNISYYLQPIILLILGIFIYGEKVTPLQWGLILLALSGVLLTIDLLSFNSTNLIYGASLALLAALFYSLLTLLMKNSNMDYFKVIFIQLFIGTLLLAPFVHFKQLSFKTCACVFIIAVIHTLFAYYLYYNAIKKTNFTQIAIFSYLDPIVAIGSDVLFFNRHLDFYQLGGIGLTFCSLYILVTRSKKPIVKQEKLISVA